MSHQVRHDAPAIADWSDFRRRFVGGDGRVIDNANGGVSHSEGQGWGMMLAVAFDDVASFDLIADWTKRNDTITDFLSSFGYKGVPLCVFYPAGGKKPIVMPQILTESLVIDTIKGE